MSTLTRAEVVRRLKSIGYKRSWLKFWTYRFAEEEDTMRFIHQVKIPLLKREFSKHDIELLFRTIQDFAQAFWDYNGTPGVLKDALNLTLAINGYGLPR